MIVGNGLIAKAFGDIDDVVVFASGVSNSRETRTSEFEREEELFRSMPKDLFMVYFSTCSVYEYTYTPYIAHKLHMESLTADRRGLIIRLPQVAGRSKNPHTLLNFLHDRVKHGKRFEVWSGAVRYIIDIDDVVGDAKGRILRMTPGIINYTTKPTSVLTIVKAFENIIGKKANYKIVRKGVGYTIPGVKIDSNINRILNKYYGREPRYPRAMFSPISLQETGAACLT